MHRTFPSFGIENSLRESRLLHQQGVEQPQQQPPQTEILPLPRQTPQLNKAANQRGRALVERTTKEFPTPEVRNMRPPARPGRGGARPEIGAQRGPEDAKQQAENKDRIAKDQERIRKTPEYQQAEKNFRNAVIAQTDDEEKADRMLKSIRGFGLGAEFERFALNVMPFLMDMGLIDLTRPLRGTTTRPGEGPNKQRLEELETAKATREKSVKAAQGSVSRGMWGMQFANHSLIETADKQIDAELKLLNDTQNLPPELQARIPELKKVKEELQKIRKASVNVSQEEKKKKEAAEKGGA